MSELLLIRCPLVLFPPFRLPRSFEGGSRPATPYLLASGKNSRRLLAVLGRKRTPGRSRGGSPDLRGPTLSKVPRCEGGLHHFSSGVFGRFWAPLRFRGPPGGPRGRTSPWPSDVSSIFDPRMFFFDLMPSLPHQHQGLRVLSALPARRVSLRLSRSPPLASCVLN